MVALSAFCSVSLSLSLSLMDYGVVTGSALARDAGAAVRTQTPLLFLVIVGVFLTLVLVIDGPVLTDCLYFQARLAVVPGLVRQRRQRRAACVPRRCA